MSQHIGLITLIVRNYDEAIDWYVSTLGFELVSDTPLGGAKRWVVVAPRGAQTGILLAEASDDVQTSRIGNQTGGRVALFLHTDNFEQDHATMLKAGVKFHELPRHEPYGIVAVFEDLYGNLWDMIQRAV